ncbi:hypothetical protein ACE6H2_019559 [Prunus campanulata]
MKEKVKKRGKTLRPNLSYKCHITRCRCCPFYQMHCELMNPYFVSSFLFIGFCGPL